MVKTRSRGPAEPVDSAAAAMPSLTTAAPAAAPVSVGDAAKSPDHIEEDVFYDAVTYDITTSAKKEISEALKDAFARIINAACTADLGFGKEEGTFLPFSVTRRRGRGKW